MEDQPGAQAYASIVSYRVTPLMKRFLTCDMKLHSSSHASNVTRTMYAGHSRSRFPFLNVAVSVEGDEAKYSEPEQEHAALRGDDGAASSARGFYWSKSSTSGGRRVDMEKHQDRFVVVKFIPQLQPLLYWAGRDGPYSYSMKLC